MGNESQKNYFYERNDINKIKQSYLILKEGMSNSDSKYIFLNTSLHTVFLERYDNLFGENELKEMIEKLKSYDKEKNIKEITKINEMIKEAQLLEQKATDDFDFYNRLIKNIKNKYDDWIITKEAYIKICEDVVDTVINNLIKYEKELIILRDKIRQFNNLF